MATNAALEKRIKALEDWKLAHVGPSSNHVLSGHTHTHSHPEFALTSHTHTEPAPEPTPEPEPPPPSPSPVPTTALYGMAIGADTLANTNIGDSERRAISCRFRAGTTAKLVSIDWYIIANGNTGYSNGNGGRIEITLQADAEGIPSGQALATVMFAPGNPAPAIRHTVFPSPGAVVEGRLYHIVMRNVDADPVTNHLAHDGLYSWQNVRPEQPKYPDSDWALLISDNGAPWKTRPITPIMGLTYDNGFGEGVGYVGCFQQTQPPISGSSKVRELFTPKRDVVVSRIAVRLKRDSGTSGTSPITVRIDQGASVLAQGQIPAASFPLGQQVDAPQNANKWASVAVPTVTLKAGTQYTLVLSAPADTVFRAEVLQKGSGYNFPTGSYFTDGYAQRSVDNGSTWLGMDQPGGSTNRTDSDIQFWLGAA